MRTDEQIAIINNALLIAAEYGVQAEVMASALMAMAETPYISFDEAIQYGLDEWVK